MNRVYLANYIQTKNGALQQTKNQKPLEVGLCVTDKRCCTNFLLDTEYFVDPTCHE